MISMRAWMTSPKIGIIFEVFPQIVLKYVKDLLSAPRNIFSTWSRLFHPFLFF